MIAFGNKPKEVVYDENAKMRQKQREHESQWDASQTYAILHASKGATRGERRQFCYPWNAAADAGDTPIELSSADKEAALEKTAMTRFQAQIGAAMKRATGYPGDIELAFSQKLRTDNECHSAGDGGNQASLARCPRAGAHRRSGAHSRRRVQPALLERSDCHPHVARE